MSISYAVFCSSRRPPRPTLFPYTTLFRSFVLVSENEIRSAVVQMIEGTRNLVEPAAAAPLAAALRLRDHLVGKRVALVCSGGNITVGQLARSEEHTSELQSHVNLVCRLLLEPATTETYTLSLHDALPIFRSRERERDSLGRRADDRGNPEPRRAGCRRPARSGTEAARPSRRQARGAGLQRRQHHRRPAREIGRAHV